MMLQYLEIYNFDIMLEIEDKESGVLKAKKILEKDNRFVKRG